MRVSPVVLLVAVGLALASSAQCLETTWIIEDVPNTGDVGGVVALALDDLGKPHLAYTGGGTFPAWPVLCYLEDPVGTWEKEVIDSLPGSFPDACAIALSPEGTPHVAYYMAYCVRYASKNQGTWVLESVESKLRTSSTDRIAITFTGQPSIYYHVDNAPCPSGPVFRKTATRNESRRCWEPTMCPDSIGYLYGSICPVGSHLLYCDHGQLMYDNEIVPVGSVGGTGSADWSLAIDSAGNPHVSCNTEAGLKYAVKVGGSWTVETIDASATAGLRSNSVAVDQGGIPHVAFASSLGDLCVGTREGGAWSITTVDTACGSFPSMALTTDGLMRIAYYGGPIGNLRVRYASEVSLSDVKSEEAALSTSKVVVSPQPSKRGATIRLTLSEAGESAVRIFDVSGREVRSLFRGTLPRGPQSLQWDGRDQGGRSVASGVYFVRLEAGSRSITSKAILIE